MTASSVPTKQELDKSAHDGKVRLYLEQIGSAADEISVLIHKHKAYGTEPFEGDKLRRIENIELIKAKLCTLEEMYDELSKLGSDEPDSST